MNMILVRDIFQLKFGKAKEAMTMLREGLKIAAKGGYTPDRLLTDLTGEYYTLIMEGVFANLSEFEKTLTAEMASDEWKQWYQKFTPLVDSGRREIFNIVK